MGIPRQDEILMRLNSSHSMASFNNRILKGYRMPLIPFRKSFSPEPDLNFHTQCVKAV